MRCHCKTRRPCHAWWHAPIQRSAKLGPSPVWAVAALSGRPAQVHGQDGARPHSLTLWVQQPVQLVSLPASAGLGARLAGPGVPVALALGWWSCVLVHCHPLQQQQGALAMQVLQLRTKSLQHWPEQQGAQCPASASTTVDETSTASLLYQLETPESWHSQVTDTAGWHGCHSEAPTSRFMRALQSTTCARRFAISTCCSAMVRRCSSCLATSCCFSSST